MMRKANVEVPSCYNQPLVGALAAVLVVIF